MARRLSALDGEAVLPLADAKAYLRVLHTDEDALIIDLRDAAIAHVERVSHHALARATFEGASSVMMMPLVSIDRVTVATDSGDVVFEGDALDDQMGRDDWPVGEVTVRYTAGFATAREAGALLQAVRMLLAHWYNVRCPVVLGTSAETVPLGVSTLIDSYRPILL